MRQLILKIPDKAHRDLRILAAAKEKTMTDVVIDWIQREADALATDPLMRALYSESGLPTREYTQEEVDGFIKADDATPEELKEWARNSLGKGKKK